MSESKSERFASKFAPKNLYQKIGGIMEKYLRMIAEEIHSVVIATVDKEGHPVTRVIDIMLADEDSLYFLTAKGKAFYEQLINNPFISLSGMAGGEGTMNKKAVSVRGKAISIGEDKLDEIFEKNPYMAEIYPDKASRMALEVFQIDEGQGEYFDLSTKPITRDSFLLGKLSEKLVMHGYFITDKCHGCKICYSRCPQKCMDLSVTPLVIRQENCLHCGNCMSICPFGAVEKR